VSSHRDARCRDHSRAQRSRTDPRPARKDALCSVWPARTLSSAPWTRYDSRHLIRRPFRFSGCLPMWYWRPFFIGLRPCNRVSWLSLLRVVPESKTMCTVFHGDGPFSRADCSYGMIERSLDWYTTGQGRSCALSRFAHECGVCEEKTLPGTPQLIHRIETLRSLVIWYRFARSLALRRVGCV
jgi:hypothetical protein